MRVAVRAWKKMIRRARKKTRAEKESAEISTQSWRAAHKVRNDHYEERHLTYREAHLSETAPERTRDAKKEEEHPSTVALDAATHEKIPRFYFPKTTGVSEAASNSELVLSLASSPLPCLSPKGVFFCAE